jgi:4-hydroxy-tetrahydrodipicolinate synthase
MKEVRKFQGIIPPAITVFDNKGEIDRAKTIKFIRHLIDEGVHGIFVAGSTGEAPLMSEAQRREIIDIGVEAVGGKVPLFAGTGHHSTKISIELTKYAEKAGADVAMAYLPHYPKPTQEGFYEHYKAIAEAVNIPLFVYNCFEQYGVEIAPEVVARLADEGYIHGIKDSTFDIDHISRVLALTGGKVTVLTGLETKVLPSLCLGADGSICTVGNLIPRHMVEIYDLFREGKIEEAGKKQLAVMELFDVLVSSVEIQVVKAGLQVMGHDIGDALMPACKIPADIKTKLKEILPRFA